MAQFFIQEEKSIIENVVNRLAYSESCEVDELLIGPGSVEVRLRFEPDVNSWDDFSEIFPELLSENCLTRDKILGYLYEQGKDWEWYGDDESCFPIDTFRGDLQEAIPRLTEEDLLDLIIEDNCSTTIVMDKVAERIFSDLSEWLIKGSDGKLNLSDGEVLVKLAPLVGKYKIESLDFYSSWKDPELLSDGDNAVRVSAAYYEPNLGYGREVIKRTKRHLNLSDDDEVGMEQINQYVETAYDKDLDKVLIEDELLFKQYILHSAVAYLSNGVIVAY